MRFTIRDVLWLTVVVALVACWRVDKARENQAHAEALKKEKEPYDRDFDKWLYNKSWDKLIDDSKWLGAPQPIPLPQGFGEKPN